MRSKVIGFGGIILSLKRDKKSFIYSSSRWRTKYSIAMRSWVQAMENRLETLEALKKSIYVHLLAWFCHVDYYIFTCDSSDETALPRLLEPIRCVTGNLRS